MHRSLTAFRHAIATLLVIGPLACATAAELAEMPTLSSSNGVLDLLMVARAAPLSSLLPSGPQGWVYDICPRPRDGSMSCPPSNANLYGGTRLALQGGDTLKVRLVNKLPPAPNAIHANAEPYLVSNPTNLHTHGLLVSPRYPTRADPTFGDNSFVLTLNPNNLPLPSQADSGHIHSDLRIGHTDYKIEIPAAHPPGIFWFHPHAHGIALNQVSSGMAGMLTVGNVLDYLCKDASCAAYAATIPVRHMLLKDTQILSADTAPTVLDQQDSQFCSKKPQRGETAPRQGSCPGVTKPLDPDGQAYPGGKWFFTLNGQPYPSVSVATTQGEVWRIATASGSATYDLQLQGPTGNSMLVQVLSIDGVAVSTRQGMSASDLAARFGAKINFFPCPGVTGVSGGGGQPVCTNRIVMMPSSRMEIWVAYRDDAGNLVSPPPGGAQATLRTAGFSTGGDDWPAVDLAAVSFSGPNRSPSDPLALTTGGQRYDPAAIAKQLLAANEAVGPDPRCKPLKPGHGRRIFFSETEIVGDTEGFGLGYEEIDALGLPVPGTQIAVQQFDPQQSSICLPLGPGNTPTTEFWQLVNLTSEDHNFHMHQLRFWLLKDPNGSLKSALAHTLDGSEIAYDNLPVRHGKLPCDTITGWHEAHNPASPNYGRCDGDPVQIAIPFSVAGDYLYHCHILEHEDGGMMAPIRVRAAAK